MRPAELPAHRRRRPTPVPRRETRTDPPRLSGHRVGILSTVGDEIELAAKTTGEVVEAVLESSGATIPMKEVTGWLASWLHPRHVASAAKQIERAVAKLEAAGVRPGAVRDEQMRALLEEGAREEDETLQEVWANMLANGLAGGKAGVPRAYAEVLRQLDPVEIVTLDRIANGEIQAGGSHGGTRVIAQGNKTGTSSAALYNRERVGLVEISDTVWQKAGVPPPPGVDPLRTIGLTPFGGDFVNVCRPPS